MKLIKNDKALKTIGEVAEIISVAKTVLRFWEKSFDHIKPLKNNGIRYYSSADIDNLLQIKELLYIKKHSIKDAIDIIKESSKLNNKTYLKKLLARLYKMREELLSGSE